MTLPRTSGAVSEVKDSLQRIADLVSEEADAATLQGPAKPAHVLWIPLGKRMLSQDARIAAEHLVPAGVGRLLATPIEEAGELYTPIAARSLGIQLGKRIHRLRPALNELTVVTAGIGSCPE